MTTVADFFADKPYTAALIGSVAILAIGGASLFAYKLGLFKRLIVKENVLLGPYLVLYREVKGPYSKLGGEFSALAQQMVDNCLVHVSEQQTHPLLGVYLTNPRTTPAAECQALVASVFRQGADVATPADVERACSMLSKLSVVRTGEIKVGYIPASLSIATRTPLPSSLPWGVSIAVGAVRAYPALTRALAGKEGAEQMVKGSLEVYSPKKGYVVFAMPTITRPSILVPLDIATPLTAASEASSSKGSQAS